MVYKINNYSDPQGTTILGELTVTASSMIIYTKDVSVYHSEG